MTPSKFICLLVILSVSLAYGEVDLGKLSHETSTVMSELDDILAHASIDPLSRVSDRPLAPRPTSEAERRMLRPILIESSGASAPMTLPSLLQRADAIISHGSPDAEMQPALTMPATAAPAAGGAGGAPVAPVRVFPTAGGYIPPNLDLPSPPEDIFQRERARFNASAPTPGEFRLRHVDPKPVVLEAHPGVIDAEVLVKAQEVLPRDPNTVAMLAHFNQKYGVDEAGAVAPDTDLSEKELHDIEIRGEESEVARDFRAVYDSIDEVKHLKPDTMVADLDKQLGALWNKRWEYLQSERTKANELVKKTFEDPQEHRVDPMFVGELNIEDPASNIGRIVVSNEDPAATPVVPSIPDRVGFTPDVSFEGPNVIAVSVDKASLPDPSKEFFTPTYEASKGRPAVPTMSIIPASRTVRHRFRKLGFHTPDFREGDEFDWNAAVKPAYEGSTPFAVKQNDEIVAANY